MNGNTVCEIVRMDVTPLSDPALFGLWLSRMPESRKRKVLSMRHAEGQRLRLGVGILLFQALQQRGIDPCTATVAENGQGKLFLPEYPEIHFSLSHSGNWALCAICGRPVGCDVERTHRGNASLARRFFHPEEQAALTAEPEGEGREWLFTRLWTRKEAYLKADGRGLSLPMESFSALNEGEGVWFDEGPAVGEYAFSACVQGGEDRPAFRWREASLTE